jgi:oxygen-independent coproporphyrinogen III oxidase
MKGLIQKYNIPGPRYTSYPTVPYWNEGAFSKKSWLDSVVKSFDKSNDAEGISLYIHLPFCENLCTFCGCHKHITKRHSVETPYIESVLQEWKLYVDLLQGTPRIKEIHLGGGTPTFFSPASLDRLINGILERAVKTENCEFSFEGHPVNTTREHLEKLYELGFRRSSFGVQDYNEKVQKTINRIQPFQLVQQATEWSREVGFTSVSHDLVFGLPHQTLDAVTDSIEKTARLMPDRIAFYSYAHVPWIKGLGQRGYSDDDLPKDEVKRALYEYGKKRFLEIGYEEIGMDHFALKTDSLYTAVREKTLHRNFMGYSSGKSQLMIGLGMSAISDSWFSFAQNVKSVKGYEQQVGAGEIPVFRGHVLSDEDLVIRKHILNIMCHFRTDWSEASMQFPELPDTLSRLGEMVDDGLIEIHPNSLLVKEEGRPFIRNICMAFDLHLIKKAPQTRVFSMII